MWIYITLQNRDGYTHRGVTDYSQEGDFFIIYQNDITTLYNVRNVSSIHVHEEKEK